MVVAYLGRNYIGLYSVGSNDSLWRTPLLLERVLIGFDLIRFEFDFEFELSLSLSLINL